MKTIIALIISIYLSGSDSFVPSKIVSVYDGDTFKVDLSCDVDVLCKNIPVRVYGVDTPELRTTDDSEKILGYMAKEVTYNFLKKDDIILRQCVRGKYFRLVCRVYSGENELSKELVDSGLAVEYFGGTKIKDWSKHRLKDK